MLLALWLGPWACADRELEDGMAPELLEQYRLACEGWCMLLDECEREDDLREAGAVTADCEERTPERTVDFESACDPDEWPPPPT